MAYIKVGDDLFFENTISIYTKFIHATFHADKNLVTLVKYISLFIKLFCNSFFLISFFSPKNKYLMQKFQITLTCLALQG